MKYEPLSKRAVEYIKFYDKQFHQGINRNRFYTWLVQVGQDVQIRHVCVKCKKGTSKRFVKEVARFSVDDPQMHIKDLVFYHAGGGYSVDWRPEGLDTDYRPYDYKGRWETEEYKSSGLWHINAVVVNPTVLNRMKRFKYCNWWSNCGDIVNYLKTYVEHPGIEMLSKMGLARWCQKPSIYKKCETDKAFAKFLFRNHLDIIGRHYTIPLVLKGYKTGRPLAELLDEKVQKELESKRVDEVKVAEVADAWGWLETLGRKYCIVLPRSHAEFIEEGQKLEHCVLQEHYAQRVQNGRSIIAFVRLRESKEAPLVTVEFDLKSGKVVQCYGRRNSEPDKSVRSFVDRAFMKAKKVEVAA